MSSNIERETKIKKELENKIKKLEKELQKLLGKQVIIEEIRRRAKIANKKINLLYRDLVDKVKDPYERGSNEVLLSVALDNAVFCYGLGLDSHCVVELYGVVELFIIRSIERSFLEIKPSTKLKDFLKKEGYQLKIECFTRKVRTRDLAMVLKKMGTFDNADFKTFCDLETLRNSYAHKNVIQLSKHTQVSRIPVFFEIDNPKIIKIDTKKHIKNTLKILRKLHRHDEEIEKERKHQQGKK